jgi:hypothetical protein
MLAMRARTHTTKPMNLAEATNEARKIQSRHTGSIAIVTENRLSRKARKTWFGFRFAVNEATNIGREIINDDGSISVIREVVA